MPKTGYCWRINGCKETEKQRFQISMLTFVHQYRYAPENAGSNLDPS